MGRKTETVLTYKVKIKLPTGANAAEIHEHLRAAISSYNGGKGFIPPEDFTVALLKKEVNYA